jgi:AcrR family transcriptional regulator
LRVSAQARREQLVAAAIRVMSREGLDAATTRRIAEEAGAPLSAFHYAFRDKNELLTEVVGAITLQIETILREAVDPSMGLAAAINNGLRAFWRYAVSDDGLQLMQYELAIFCRRTEGFGWLAEWQYARYASTARETFAAAAAHEKSNAVAIGIADLANFIVAALDGLVLQYQVTHEADRCERDLGNIIKAATLLALPPSSRQDGNGQ